MANEKEMTTAQAIQYLADGIDNYGYTYGDPTNDFGMTIGDELHDIAFQFGRIADALEKIANK